MTRVLYCPGCQWSGPVETSLASCPRCGWRLISWPADLPLPMEANVRTMREANVGLYKVAQAVLVMAASRDMERFGHRRPPADNRRGWWN